MKQIIEHPPECPNCGASPLCITDLSPPSGMVHCHNRRENIECGWQQRFDLDPAATEYIFVSRETP